MISPQLRVAIVGLLHCSVVLLLAPSAEAQSTWRQTLRLTSQAGEQYGLFGYSVSYSDDSILVGAPDILGTGFGDKAYRFGRAHATQDVVYQDNSTFFATIFGADVASNGEVDVVSNPGEFVDLGKVYLFDAQSGQSIGALASTQPSSDERFGDSVAIDSSHILVGATTEDTLAPGSAYLFDLSTREPLFRFQESTIPTDHWYGSDVGLSVSHAFVGSPGAPRGGSVYAYNLETGVQDFVLKAPQGVGSSFGVSLDIDGDLILVGSSRARINEANRGAAFLFDASTGDLLQQFVAPDGQANDFFGYSVAIDDGLVVVGAMYEGESATGRGAAYVFDALSGEFLAKLTAADSQYEPQFGRSVDIHNGEVLVGAPEARDNGRIGVVYAFKAVIPGDYDGDGDVSQADYNVWANAIGRTSGDLMADGNGDGVIDAADYTVWRDAYAVAVPSTSVPEPTSLVAIVTSIACSLAAKR